ncbi:MAG TPA: hypothetical protein PK096_02745 [Candidatus Saccharibacteria bacterium]|nr:hypothetical protein [Candidatus Saccharibacteria bacterium]HRK94262.1 hypothetical protein [Candidatus Saccharibacteria bacterium]
MDDEESLNPNVISDDLAPKKLRPYDLLLRQSRKMGGLATRTYDVTKEFLKQDVSALHPDRLLFNRIQPEASQPTNDNEQQSQGNESTGGPGSQKAKASEGIREGEESSAMTLDPKENLHKIVQKSHQILAGAQTVILPVNLFPDSVIVDRTKVTITKRTFFWTASVISIRIEDVLNVTCSTGPIFGSLTISSRVMNSTDHYEIDYFWRKDALYLKQIIQGYVIAQHNQIETSHLDRKELIETLLELGRDSGY